MKIVCRYFSLILFLSANFSCLGQQYTNLVLKGGGIRGIAYAGALKVLEEQGVMQSTTRVGGTSVGALTGVLVCLGYKAKEIEELMMELDVATFNDGEGYFVGGQHRLRKHYGWYKGRELEDWVAGLIKEKTGYEGLTFNQLHHLVAKDGRFKDLYVTSTNLTKQCLQVFSWESTPDMPVQVAVRASISIPLYYTAVFIDSAGNTDEDPDEFKRYDVYVDGGLLANYPVNLFNTNDDNAAHIINEHTLGLKLERPEQITYRKDGKKGIAPFDIRTFNSYIGALYNMTIEQLNQGIPYDEERKHTIYISTSNLNPRVRNITPEQKRLLFENGAQAARLFFSIH